MGTHQLMRLTQRWPAGAPGRSRTTCHAGLVWTVANAADISAPLAGQVEQSLRMLQDHLVEAGSSKEHLLSVQVILDDIANRTLFDSLWKSWIGPDPSHWPQRACLAAGLAPGLRLELIAVAALPEARAPTCRRHLRACRTTRAPPCRCVR